MIKLADTKHRYSTDEYALAQFRELFEEELLTKYVAEFDPFWDYMLPQALKGHERSGVGEWAGSGCVDYNEAKALYIFTRALRPKIVMEFGYHSGISSSFIARGLEMNGHGQLHTVDISPDHGYICPAFRGYQSQDIIIQHHSTDAVDFIRDTKLTPNLTFTDASHEYVLTRNIAVGLKERWPHTVHLYHEWGMSSLSSELDQSYISFKQHIGKLYERDAFEEVFGSEFSHGGLVGSCGLGIVMPL